MQSHCNLPSKAISSMGGSAEQGPSLGTEAAAAEMRGVLWGSSPCFPCPGGETSRASSCHCQATLVVICGTLAAKLCFFQAHQPLLGLYQECSAPGMTQLWPWSCVPSSHGSQELGAKVLLPARAEQAE